MENTKTKTFIILAQPLAVRLPTSENATFLSDVLNF